MLTAGTRLGPYEITGSLGAGGMGHVYKARDTRLDRVVAIKVLAGHVASDPELRQRFEREARAISSITHPHICTLHDVGQQEGIDFLVMEYVEGRTLAERLAHGPLPLDEALRAADEIADALDTAHRQGIVHRDVKPGNIIMTERGAKLLDFGLAKLKSHYGLQDSRLGTAAEATHRADPSGAGPTRLSPLTIRGSIIGTLHYMAPEQVEGQTTDARTDIFAFGAVLYEMVTGRKAFAGDSQAGIIASILTADPAPIRTLSLAVPRSLNHIIRKCLSKNPEQRYQHIGEVRSALVAIASTRGSRGKRWIGPLSNGWVTAAALALVAVLGTTTWWLWSRNASGTIDSVAVLPFASASANPDVGLLTDGITESLINSFSRAPEIRVVPRSTVFRYKGQDADPQASGEALDVRAVLTGRVIEKGGRLNIQVELIDVRSRSQIWGRQYEGPIADVMSIEEEIASEVAKRLRGGMSDEDRRRITRRPTESAAAYELYLKGLYQWRRRTEASVSRSIELFRQAIDKDPGYALAHTGLADAYSIQGFYNWSAPTVAFPQAKAAAARALELDDSRAETHATMAFVKMNADWDLAGAERELKRALELNPAYSTTRVWYALQRSASGNGEAAVEQMRLAVKLDPFWPLASGALGHHLHFARQYEEAIQVSRRTLEMADDLVAPHAVLGMAYTQTRQYDEAIAAFRRAIALDGHPITISTPALGYTYAVAGRRPDAERFLRELHDLSRRRYVPSYYIATTYVGLGDREKAFQWLDRAYDERSQWLLYLLKTDPMLDPLRDDPRLTALLRRVETPEWRSRGSSE